jgi:chromosome segregation ATPase
MQQDLEDEKNEATIKDLENKVGNYEAALKEKDFVIQDLEIKVKDLEAALEKKDFVIHSMEGSLAEAQAENNKLNNELLIKSEKSRNKSQDRNREEFKFAKIIEGSSGEMLRFRQPMCAAAEGCV